GRGGKRTRAGIKKPPPPQGESEHSSRPRRRVVVLIVCCSSSRSKPILRGAQVRFPLDRSFLLFFQRPEPHRDTRKEEPKSLSRMVSALPARDRAAHISTWAITHAAASLSGRHLRTFALVPKSATGEMIVLDLGDQYRLERVPLADPVPELSHDLARLPRQKERPN